jgi:methionyl-tRNA formyltransferase
MVWSLIVVTDSLKIIFAGTPAFSAVTLEALLQAGHNIVAVYTQPDRPAGRGQKLAMSPVKTLALQHHLPVYQPVTLRDAEEQKILADLNADLMIVVAYGLLLPTPVLQAPRLGCINIHASLLPRWRGAAPIQRAILAGDPVTGITIMQMEAGLDTGPMLYRLECSIESNDTTQTLHDRLASLGAEAILATLKQLSLLTPEVQDHALANYAHKILKDEAVLDWKLTANELDQKIRAFNPWPVAQTTLDGQTVRIWAACVLEKTQQAQPGTIVHAASEGIDVATGKNMLRILKLQLPGGRCLPASDILNSRQEDFAAGKIFGSTHES